MEAISNVLREFVMPAPFKMKHFAKIAACLQRRKLAASSIVTLAALLLLGSLVLSPAAFVMFSSSIATRAKAPTSEAMLGAPAPWRNQSWAGGLESSQARAPLAAPLQAEKPMTSASYTSGFDKKAAGLGPLPPETSLVRLAQPRDRRVCPDDLNCSFRSARATALPRRRPATIPAVLEPVKTASQPSGFSLPLLPAHLSLPSPHLNLPSANNLLMPFAFVSNTVVGFVKKL